MDNLLFQKQKKSNDSRIDYALILPVFLLILVGFAALWLSLQADYPSHAQTILMQQGAWLLIGMAAAFFVMHFDGRLLWAIAPIFYFLGLALMVVPIFFYSPALVAATGAKSWIAIGGTNLFQPSELMKLAYILFLSRLIVNYRLKHRHKDIITDLMLILRMFIATIPIIFILIGPHMQNDFGTLLVFLVIFAGLLLLSGVSWKILLPIIIFVLVVFAGLLFLIVNPHGQELLGSIGFHPYQAQRFQAWLHPFGDVQYGSYQQSQALIATANGGMFGVGKNATAIAVPVRESDMIFTVIAGATGFIGSAFVIFLYLYLIYRMMRTTIKANSQFYTFIAGGLTMMLLFHIFENIGATTGILPLTGIPLPFISQGGSNLISNIIGIGLILSIKYNEETPERKGKTRNKYRRKLARRMEESERRNQREERMSQSANNGSARMTRTRS